MRATAYLYTATRSKQLESRFIISRNKHLAINSSMVGGSRRGVKAFVVNVATIYLWTFVPEISYPYFGVEKFAR